jgi:long-subunit acyl-CoA synthetase (AMP-forming)
LKNINHYSRKYIIEDSGAKVALVATNHILKHINELVGKVGNLNHVLCFEDHDKSSSTSFAACLARGASASVKVPSYKPDAEELATLIYTSGTTVKFFLRYEFK